MIPVDKRLFLAILVLAAAALACTREAPTAEPWNPSGQGVMVTPCPSGAAATGACAITPTPTLAFYDLPTREPDAPILSPTPDAPKIVPTLRQEPEEYYVQRGDSLASIAARYNVDFEAIARANNIADPNNLSVGQYLLIPAPTPSGSGSDFKIIPDSELINSPTSILFDTEAYIKGKAGYLSQYQEDVDGKSYTGSQIVLRVANEVSVHPRILLAVLEYTSGWVTNPNPTETTIQYPLGYFDERRAGLYKQLSFAANQLNRGFYLWKINAIPAFLLADGAIIPVNPEVNAGTVGVQQLMSNLYGLSDWETAISVDGVFKTYQDLFGYPFDQSLEPLLPADLSQPGMQLPFTAGESWSFTGGPHAGWGDGSAWAALDFAPPGEPQQCKMSDNWVTAAADGTVIYSENGLVIQDLDGDGFPQTGWSLLYLHVDAEGRVNTGEKLKAGDQIGHPSCEGGISNATHLHIARRYNGMWIAADGSIPFNLDGWVSSGTGTEYDGFLSREGVSIEAFNGFRDVNQITH